MKVRKKPIVLDAWKVNIDSFLSGTDIPEWVNDAFTDRILTIESDGSMYIKALEGTMFTPDNHIIIKGVEGEIYAIDPRIFKRTYEII